MGADNGRRGFPVAGWSWPCVWLSRRGKSAIRAAGADAREQPGGGPGDEVEGQTPPTARSSSMTMTIG